jgi:hypothetical protein
MGSPSVEVVCSTPTTGVRHSSDARLCASRETARTDDARQGLSPELDGQWLTFRGHGTAQQAPLPRPVFPRGPAGAAPSGSRLRAASLYRRRPSGAVPLGDTTVRAVPPDGLMASG